ncbi:hypothetical protein ROZALSC1DRAFT_27894 [Rozella allomycis CSF55]|uniref:Ribosomal protein L7/L12/adaptor protein ClpS-like domain-containing protein n=1 Tax=Rozella allomycis (strain CSF55) TaxID=988480 RepID=A0A075B396_ROZAC|nr:Ribosomal protein L7/L12/adaptor protein ClpS-like domain-containing protein [Rozella allomycis CSF55]RKP20641.1 hypothetical protein ROZALSC1DRAFT_27894 [Rozella allomycis CSF55]|eukprot:EPZ35278.1 Ribosomal protein L7/L12/adaptor protein ClpS-like domain-containing protein [Rozella allomycis CSF55]
MFVSRYARRPIVRLSRFYSEALNLVSAQTQPSPKIISIVDSIASLSLMETSELERLNIQEIAMPVASAPTSAPVEDQSAEAEAAPKAKEQTEFKVILEKFDAASKAKLIREIKGLIPNLNLVQAKAFVEGAPKVIQESATKEEVENLKKVLTAVGATLKIE